jgi:hypothetical protein
MAHKRAKKEEKKKGRAHACLLDNPNIMVEDVAPLSQVEGQYFQELVDTSNTYVALAKQRAQQEWIIKMLEEKRTAVQKGEISLPVSFTLIPKVATYQENDKKKVLEELDKTIKVYKDNLKSIMSQYYHRYEEYCEASVRVREFMKRRFGNVKAQTIVPDRKIVEDEDKLFDAEIDKLLKDPNVQKEFVEASKKAAKKNKELKAQKE